MSTIASARSRRTAVFGLLIMVLSIAGVVAPARLASADNDPNQQIFPPESHPYGKSYGEWGAEWHKWLHRIPVSVNPMLDTTGANCAQGQSGNVWFLMGIPGNTGTRSCTVPHGKAIFVPIQNGFWWNWTTDPPGPHSPELQAQIRGLLSGALMDYGLAASVDGDSVTDLVSYGHESPIFDSWVPDDNIIDFNAGAGSDWLEGMSGPHYDAGVYIMVKPLTRGEHQISTSGWGGGWAGTWLITVE